MVKAKAVLGCLVTAVLLVSTGGCVVSKATHEKALAKLAATETDLRFTQDRFQRATTENARLRSGLGRLTDDCGSTSLQVKSAQEGLVRMKSNEGRITECLVELQSVVRSQAGALTGLAATIKRLEDQLVDLRKQAATLAEEPAAAPPIPRPVPF